jgi:hypothetical protein
VTGGPGLVLPRWGTRRRTREEWLERGGDPKVGNPDDEWWPTYGHQVATVAGRLRLPPMPHQRHVFDVAYELDPESPEDLWYTEADVWVMRQCGKTMGILFPVIVHRLTMMPRRIGGRQRAAFTMQDRQETRRKLEIDLIPQLVEASDSFRRITNPKGRPGRSTLEWKSSLNNGGEHLLFGQGNYMLIETPSKRAGHGGTLDVKAADEVRFGTDDRLEASAGPSQITRRSRQLWVASTAGDEDSWYMWPKVLAGRCRVERGDTETRVCSFEWALPEEADLHDPEVWYEYHPAVGHTIQVDDILDELRKAEDSPDESKIDTFRQEYANQWVRHPVIGDVVHEVVVDLQMWAQRTVPSSSAFERPRALGISVADDGRSASIAVAGWNLAGQAQVKVLDLKPGTFWIEQALAEYRDEWGPTVVTYNAGGPTAAIEGPIARGAGRVDVEPVRGQSYTAACKAFVTGFDEGRYRHLDQAWLNDAVEGARKKQRGTAWLWDMQQSMADITPLDAATVALRALEGRPPERRSAYEDEGLMTVGGRS